MTSEEGKMESETGQMAPDTILLEAYVVLSGDGLTVIEWDPGDDFTRRDCWWVHEPGRAPMAIHTSIWHGPNNGGCTYAAS